MSESHRLQMLRVYRILDTEAERIFDNMTRLASIICKTPISLISLVDERRQWFKSRVGLEATETSREVSFCAHAILERGTFTVEDALKDSRFAQNALVTSDPKIRFYAGAPLRVASGEALGTLCVIDTKPRRLTRTQRESLEALRDTTVALLEARRAVSDMQALSSFLPVCAWCHSVRDARGLWHPLEKYVKRAMPVTHGICPDCMATSGDVSHSDVVSS